MSDVKCRGLWVLLAVVLSVILRGFRGEIASTILDYRTNALYSCVVKYADLGHAGQPF
jgi:hypothetical protein